MVRKRSRTSKKYYESDDNDTDSDFALDDSPAEPAPKKYSLRQRKRSLFLADYEYEDDEDIPPPKHESEDEDFEVEAQVEINVNETPHSNSDNTFISHIEPETMPEDELIDFEDVIRADIVVNKNRIDYDNIITKTEIKLQPSSITTPVAAPPVKSKRGRKPKARPRKEYEYDLIGHMYEPETEVQEEDSDYEQPVRTRRERKPKVRPETEVDSSVLEPEMDLQEEYDDANDKDYDPNDDIEEENHLLTCVQANIQEIKQSETTDIQPNWTVEKVQVPPLKTPDAIEQESVKSPEDVVVGILDSGSIDRENSNNVEDSDSNNKTNSFVKSPSVTPGSQLCDSSITQEPVLMLIPSEPSDNQKHPHNSVIKFNEKQNKSAVNGSSYNLEQPEVQLELKEEINDDSDDDVVLIEEKNTEVIVLDD